ncbi:MAG: inorganic phosphate transporter [Verrucomicrobia bacterium]|nr:inorganic phosphate transporter [Verrucomicrobiota bacterium]
MDLFGEHLAAGNALFLLLALGMALSFEFVNGFHDTANAVATVIYTHSLRPWMAVVWSGLWNLFGVLTSTGAVAFGVVALLPVELVLNVGSGAGFAMVFALLLSAILWNLGTWYMGLPASSSHTLIGAIMGVGLANSMLSPGHVFGEGVNWAKAEEVFSSLLVSPVVGFVGSAVLLLLAKLVIRRPELYRPPEPNTPPPLLVRLLLIGTCTGVSFAHGSNDGQKGMGLIMLILVGILPGAFALNLAASPATFHQLTEAAHQAVASLDRLAGGQTMADNDASVELSNYLKTTGQFNDRVPAALSTVNHGIVSLLEGKPGFAALPSSERPRLRTNIYLVGETINKLNKQGHLNDPALKQQLTGYRSRLKGVTDYIPVWVKVAVACALGFGTMIGWKRIVVTVGEKIGKSHLTYGQGASAELVAMGTILAADRFGLPVSTTHVLSSGVAGTMAANHSGLQTATLRNIVLAWVLTLPVCVLLGALTFAAGLYIVFNLFGLK